MVNKQHEVNKVTTVTGEVHKIIFTIKTNVNLSIKLSFSYERHHFSVLFWSKTTLYSSVIFDQFSIFGLPPDLVSHMYNPMLTILKIHFYNEIVPFKLVLVTS